MPTQLNQNNTKVTVFLRNNTINNYANTYFLNSTSLYSYDTAQNPQQQPNKQSVKKLPSMLYFVLILPLLIALPIQRQMQILQNGRQHEV